MENAPEKVLCKFKCQGVTKRVGWSGIPFVYEADFGVVHASSEDNARFFAATPGGSLKLCTLRDDFFEVGREYFVELTSAVAP